MNDAEALVVGMLTIAVTWCAVVSDFAAWQREHNVVYTSLEASQKASVAFAENDKIVREHNKQPGQTYKLGHNRFSDLTNAEYRARFLSKHVGALLHNVSVAESPRPPRVTPDELGEASVDWVARGAVTAVKDQVGCAVHVATGSPPHLDLISPACRTSHSYPASNLHLTRISLVSPSFLLVHMLPTLHTLTSPTPCRARAVHAGLSLQRRRSKEPLR